MENKGRMLSTMFDMMNSEMMPDCSCKREKAFYFCKAKTCPNNQTQPYYCVLCADEEEEKHINHSICRINREIEII